MSSYILPLLRPILYSRSTLSGRRCLCCRLAPVNGKIIGPSYSGVILIMLCGSGGKYCARGAGPGRNIRICGPQTIIDNTGKYINRRRFERADYKIVLQPVKSDLYWTYLSELMLREIFLKYQFLFFYYQHYDFDRQVLWIHWKAYFTLLPRIIQNAKREMFPLKFSSNDSTADSTYNCNKQGHLWQRELTFPVKTVAKKNFVNLFPKHSFLGIWLVVWCSTQSIWLPTDANSTCF